MSIPRPAGYANEAPRRQALREALQNDQVHGALLLALEDERRTPSFNPGDDFAITAFREGRKRVLEELIRMSEQPA